MVQVILLHESFSMEHWAFDDILLSGVVIVACGIRNMRTYFSFVLQWKICWRVVFNQTQTILDIFAEYFGKLLRRILRAHNTCLIRILYMYMYVYLPTQYLHIIQKFKIFIVLSFPIQYSYILS